MSRGRLTAYDRLTALLSCTSLLLPPQTRACIASGLPRLPQSKVLIQPVIPLSLVLWSKTAFTQLISFGISLISHHSQGGAIDPAGFADSDNSLHVVYKIDGNSLGGGGTCGNGDGSHSTPIMLQAVEADGVTPTGTATQILDRDTSDGPLVEAPSLVLVSGTYYLFFSSNCYNGLDYDTSYATASAVGGPYTKASSPLLVSGDDGGALNSPGSVTVGPAGTQMVFHSDSVAGDSSLRQMWTAGIAARGGVVSVS